ncbi:hypothetical protein [Pedobacter nyackensis]|uniref:Uncharacterized protein n=1 Tax=Pedobacter nyackensis TaxID=475255 RepID=A0A1W2DAX1_9SPHI|nr:hypothetical protein [Pedobacter nyackensis]SMC94659.1 hypothetical protein SAMN04488101_106112 [Pedobacter nyackensis]
MGYAKERGKLEKLVAKVADINTFNEKSLATLIDTHEKYSHTVRILKNKEPEIFGDLYKNELEEVKAGKKSVKESDSDEARQNNFTVYKDVMLKALEKTINTTKETL